MRSVWLFLFTILYLFLYLNKHFGTPFFLAGYLSDLLSIPVMLGWTSLIIRTWVKADFRPGFAMVLAAFAMVSLMFEYVFPNFAGRGTADLLDVLCYAAGSVGWLLLEGRIFRSENEAEP